VITPNLASRPFLNTRPVWVMTIAAAAIALILIVLNIRFFVVTNRAVADELAMRDALEARYGELGASARQEIAILNRVPWRTLEARVKATNLVLQEHAFSWLRMLDDIDRLKARVREAELELRTSGESRPPAWVMVQPFGPRDDLQRLEGVDPSLERTLNRLGIYHFHQIARFEASDVEWLVQHADGVPEHTIRESWIADASRLAGVHRN